MYRLYGHHEELEGLKRVPDYFTSRMTVCRFVCANLPKLADALWKRSAKDLEKVVAALASSNMDCVKNRAQYQRDARERREIWKQSNNDLAGRTLAWGAYKDHRLKLSRSAWTTCK